MADDSTTVQTDGHRLKLTHLDKVLYPATGTTKADVLRYYAEVAAVMIPHLAGRPVTQKRWPDGVDHKPFLQRNLAESTPDRVAIEHSDRTVDYPLVSSPATLVWLAQNAALELHTGYPHTCCCPHSDGRPVDREAGACSITG